MLPPAARSRSTILDTSSNRAVVAPRGAACSKASQAGTTPRACHHRGRLLSPSRRFADCDHSHRLLGLELTQRRLLPQRNELEPRPARRHAQLPSGEVATTPLPPGRFSEPKSRAWRCPVRMLPSLCAVAPAHSMRCPRAGREPGHPLWQSAPAGCVHARQDRAGRARLIPCDTSHVSLNTRSDCLWQPCHHWR